jgi:8-oxo-dGTP pyrophosphatase MutT (NUDIX family)
MNTIRAAGFIVYKKEHDTVYFLLLHYNAGHWDFAKGKVEKSESLAEAAQRELFEETALRPDVIEDFSYTLHYALPHPDGSSHPKEVTLFLTTVHDERVQLSDEHIAYSWFAADNALARLTHTNAQEALMSAVHYLET